ncbi:MAG: aspartate-semialdehyde dehydrogenase [Candidatus Omnitrophica bacterium]|jgi:aspartate-semialdehyde dehydrogenase|nr:aspartate-semialdehyde dehydrogenase [Candidatus Omnitrophota bacterium]MDD5078858.1 aspartate-semialdehyde dehydrogenase [Candidatus Omnitrophota bacterium]
MKKKEKYNIAVVGAGAVGIEMLRCLKDRKFPVDRLKILARSSREMEVDGAKYQVSAISPEAFEGVDIALFAGTEGEKGASVTYAVEAVKRGAVVIDNGADFRMDPDVPLVVPEVNAKDIKRHKGIIANPNCSTIQMVVALSPIHKKAGIKRVIVTTLQAASGAGKAAVEQLKDELKQIAGSDYRNIQADVASKVMPQQLAYNVFPQIGGFADFDFTSEEWKLVKETHKIMGDKKIKVSATTVRVPVRIGHSEAVYIETKKTIAPEAVKELLSNSPGIVVIDDSRKSLYPMPKDVEGKYDTYVGRIRQDPFVKNGLWLWVVADNLLKGAASNTIQIAEELIR